MEEIAYNFPVRFYTYRHYLLFSAGFSTSNSTVAGADAFAVGMLTSFIGVVWVFLLTLEAAIFFCGRYLLRDQKYAFDLE